MGGKIEAYLDCSSPYSYIALHQLRKQRRLLSQYGVEVEMCPVFLGGINVATGNKPPSTLPAKGKYGPYDLKRTVDYYGTVPLSGPPFFPMLSIMPQRCMLVIKSKYSRERFEKCFESTWIYCFNRHIDISKPENMTQLLSEHFSGDEVKEILKLAGTKEFKDLLTSETKKAVEQYGAFGCPWLWMTNAEGKSEPCFGSDRWAYVYKFLGVPFVDLRIIDKEQGNDGRLQGEKINAKAARL